MRSDADINDHGVKIIDNVDCRMTTDSDFSQFEFLFFNFERVTFEKLKAHNSSLVPFMLCHLVMGEFVFVVLSSF